ncbi:MAG: T9SS type A sorting domain-containing protein [Saprospiraceae bacterium]|nr:T9SS type A sorting domain-containing protein [Saprospiraceae bacterium]
MRAYIIVFILAFCRFIIFSQVVTTDPAFPIINDQVTVFFDASKGSGGLKDCNCDVYVHTGVITNESTGPGDWKHVKTTWGTANAAWKMTKISANYYSWEITPSIKAYYGIGANEIVKKIALVFRNSNGSKVGKESGDQDIFIDVYPENSGLLVNMQSPSTKNFLAKTGDTIKIKFAVSKIVSISVQKDNAPFYTGSGNKLDTFIIAETSGNHRMDFMFFNDQESVKDSFKYTIPGNVIVADLPQGIEDGINILNDSIVIFSLYAPDKEFVHLIGDFNSWEFNADFQMNNTPDGKHWWLEVSDLSPENEYGFQYIVDGKIRIGDPYSDLILDPNNDKYIENSTFQGLKPYPSDKTFGMVSVLSTKKDEFQWKYDNYQRPEKEKLIIYELLLRDFLKDHSYRSLTDTLEYLNRLGINTIQLMPVNEFEGNIGWGYNPSYHYALDKFYGTPEAFKTLVDEAHKKGMAVVLDIVYNHAFDQSPLAMLYWDSANSRPAANSPWFNAVPKHPFNVGNDFNHESAATKYYVKRGLKNWIEEYHVDGYRFDLSKGFTQRQSSDDGQMAAYDAGRISTLKEYADHIWITDPEAYLILEHFATNSEEKELSDYGMMLWGNNNKQYNEATMGFTSNISNITHKQKGWSKPHLVGYMESHDEERLMYKNLKYGNTSGTYSVKNLITALDRMKLAGTFFFLIPGPKMIWQFAELGYDYSLFTCSNGTVSENCKLDPKPIKWDYLQVSERKKLFNTYKSLISLKNDFEVFSTNDFDVTLNGFLKSFQLNSPEMNVTVIGNFDVKQGFVNPKFQHAGLWFDYFKGDSVNITDPQALISLQPGEYRIYFDKKIFDPSVNVIDANSDYGFLIYPNPANDQIQFIIPDDTRIERYLIYDINGKLRSTETGDYENIDVSAYSPGIYIVKIIDSKGRLLTGKFIVGVR